MELFTSGILQANKQGDTVNDTHSHTVAYSTRYEVQSMEHHNLDIAPISNESKPLFINEPWLVDRTLLEQPLQREPDGREDNIRVYVPLDLNYESIVRRLDEIIERYGEANEENEVSFQIDVDAIISQLEIYDQIHYVRNMPEEGKHSLKGIDLANTIVQRLQDIPDGCAECFPFELIEELQKEYGLEIDPK